MDEAQTNSEEVSKTVSVLEILQELKEMFAYFFMCTFLVIFQDFNVYFLLIAVSISS